MNTDRLKYKEITDVILKGFYEVYNEPGDGFLESVVGLLLNFGKKPEFKRSIYDLNSALASDLH